jgi:hypothetical protein
MGRRANLHDFLLFLCWAALIFPAVEGGIYLERLGCPSDAFIHGSASGMFRSLLISAALFYPARILLYFASRNRLLRRRLEADFRNFDARKAALRGAIVIAVAGSIATLSTTDKLCASANLITRRHHLWDAPVSHRWGDVVAVEASCRRGSRGAWNTVYLLVFRDGDAVDLSDHAGPLDAQQSAIFAALRGHDFAFDAHRVDPDCIAPFRDMATRHP